MYDMVRACVGAAFWIFFKCLNQEKYKSYEVSFYNFGLLSNQKIISTLLIYKFQEE